MCNLRISRNLVFCFTTLAAFQNAHAIYIDPYNVAGAANARRVPKPGDATDPYPAVGAVTDATNDGICTGTLITTTVRKTAAQIMPDPWVLTAGHCLPGLDAPGNDNKMGLRPRGYYVNSDRAPGTEPPLPFGTSRQNLGRVISDKVRAHPKYTFVGGSEFDQGLFRLNPANNTELGLIVAGGTMGIRREPAGANKPADGVNAENFIQVGVGDSNVIDNWAGNAAGNVAYGDKRWIAGKVTTTAVPPVGPATISTRFDYAEPGNGTNANPTRHSCPGDSGGPYLFGGLIGGTHKSGADGGCNNGGGGAARYTATNVTLPLFHNWIDSYTQKAIFWDNVRIGGAVVENFLTDANSDGLDDDWQLANNIPANIMNHTVFTQGIAASSGWNYIEAIAGELQTDANRAQGEWLTANGALSIIKRTFTVGAAAMLQLDQRWNSLGVADDVGWQLDNQPINWLGFAVSNELNLDQYFPRAANIPAGQVTVYLLNAAPEPASLLSLLLGGLVLVHRRRPLSGHCSRTR